jgi:hypothetical protein
MGGLHAVFCNLAVGGSFTVGAGTRSLNKKMRRETTRLRERRSRWVEGDLKRELQDAKGIEKHKMQNGVKKLWSYGKTCHQYVYDSDKRKNLGHLVSYSGNVAVQTMGPRLVHLKTKVENLTDFKVEEFI